MTDDYTPTNRAHRRSSGDRRTKIVKQLTGTSDPISLMEGLWRWYGGSPTHSPQTLATRAKMPEAKRIYKEMRRGKRNRS